MRKSLLSIAFFAASICLAAQDKASPTIDVISVKASPKITNNGGIAMRADGLYIENAPLNFVIRQAFNAQFSDSEIVNMPSWAEDHFDIIAKVSEGMPVLGSLDRTHYTALRSQLLQQVLTTRFGLKTHTEVRQGSVYDLVPAKGGARIHATPANPPEEYISPDGRHVPRGLSVTNSSILGHGVPLAELIKSLRQSAHLDRVVIDRTGLTGNFDFALNWTPDSAAGPQDNGAPEASYPALFTAIQEQLGLKLEPARGPINTLVIDHVEKPSAN